MLYLGLMSGTSLDGIDAALVHIGEDTIRLAAGHRHPYPEALRQELHQVCTGEILDFRQVARLDMALGRVFAGAAQALLEAAGQRPAEIRAIGSHGQTLYHQPAGEHPCTVQIGNPSMIAELTGIATVADFRARDMAAGGQGAPLAPAFHQAAFRSGDRSRIIVNIGGMANLTRLPAGSGDPVTGFDTGPGNTLLDQWHQAHRGGAYDDRGAWAAGGTVQEPLLKRLLEDPYFQRPPPKSTGREHFHLPWLRSRLTGPDQDLHPRDVQATLAELTARTLAGAMTRWCGPVEEVYVCGGGAHNAHLMTRLAAALGRESIPTTEALGLHPDWVEAAAFAWLARQTLEGQAGNLPSVTGARCGVVLGGIYKK